MQIIEHVASAALVDAVSNTALPLMVAALTGGKAVDLRDEIACTIRLACAGFGAITIAALLPEARLRASLK